MLDMEIKAADTAKTGHIVSKSELLVLVHANRLPNTQIAKEKQMSKSNLFCRLLGLLRKTKVPTNKARTSAGI